MSYLAAPDKSPRVLVAGIFSFDGAPATAGDILVRDVVVGWLSAHGIAHDVAAAPPFAGGVRLYGVDPGAYTHVVFVCGPCYECEEFSRFFEYFKRCKIVGINLSMIASLDSWNPLTVLFERDSDRAKRPDLVFLTAQKLVPVVGLILVHPQREYGERGRHEEVEAAIRALLASRDVAAVSIDTALANNQGGLRTAAQVESMIARMDMVITTRLHGMAFALKNGVPALVIDAVAGGAKVLAQAKTIGWEPVFTADSINAARLGRAFDVCLTQEARARTQSCCQRAVVLLQGLEDQVLDALA
jgi:hypothetical protein